MTTAPALQLLGPDGRALDTASAPAVWQPVGSEGIATTWERTPVAAPAEAEPQPTARDDDAAERIAALEDQVAELRAKPAAPVSEAVAPVQQKGQRGLIGRAFDRHGVWLALWAAVGATASGEYELARFVGFGTYVAALLPLAIDVYVIQAYRRHRDTGVAIGLMILTNALVHLAHNGLFGVVEKTVREETVYAPHWGLIVAVSAIAPVIVWRVHRIAGAPKTAEPVPVPQRAPGPDSPAASGTAPVPVPESTPVPVPESTPVPVLGGTSVPAVTAVPNRISVPVPVPAGTARRAPRKTARGTAPKAGTGTASFDDHVRIVAGWLAEDPALSGTAIGKRLGTGDSYGRRVKRAAIHTGTDN